jgi:predicted TIM-barrel fold metal-dependent hydrolase
VIDGRSVVDAHVHVPRLSTLKPGWQEWADRFLARNPWRRAYDEHGDPVPALVDELFDAEGVDVALLFCEYSPRVTGMQPIEDLLPVVEHNRQRFRLVGNVNPHLHHPLVHEVERQLDLGAVALKLHPVHGGFRPDDREVYGAYAVCRERQVPVIIHSGTSSFPGSRAGYGDPAMLSDVVDDFPEVQFVLAHGGRGWWYDVAAFLALSRGNVWLDLAGLPPAKLPTYYARFDLARLATRWIFGTDWPGVPGAAANVRELAALGLSEELLRGVLSANAAKVFSGLGV